MAHYDSQRALVTRPMVTTPTESKVPRRGLTRRVRDKPRLLPLTSAITFNTKCLVFSELVNNDSRDVLADFTDVILVSEDTVAKEVRIVQK